SDAGAASAAATAGLSAGPGHGLARAALPARTNAVAHLARQQSAEAAELDEETPFGAVVSALAKAKGSPDEAVAAAAPGGAQAAGETKPVEPAQTPLQPIDLSFLSQPRQPKADGLQPAAFSADGALSPGQAAAAHAAAGHGAAAEGPPTPLHVVPIEIGLRALAGGRKFDIRLDPAELGRVDVNLEISDKGEVTAKLVVDRVETLHLLQRDARTLERAFEQAGLKPSDAGVNITLRDPGDQSGFRQNRNQDEPPRRGRSGRDAIEDVAAPVEAASARRLVRLGGVDLSI
ncbi:MAG: flagellar hook-length control protein FliK, partial [Bosea sp. (in: a-proteobacteria)]